MEKEHYIIGSGGFAKEVYYLTEVVDPSSVFKGFIDYEPPKEKITVRGREEQVWDENFFLNSVPPDDKISLFMGIGDPQLLSKLSKRFSKYNFPNLVHPNFIGDKRSIRFGCGNIITAGCIFTVDISIGSFNIFNLKTSLGHDVTIGDCNVFNPSCNISGEVNIGSRNMFGVNSTVLQQLKIQDDNIVGGSSLANKPVENKNVVVGVPGKRLKK